jgi:hypothetical protein
LTFTFFLGAQSPATGCWGFPWGKIFRARVQRSGVLRKVR